MTSLEPQLGAKLTKGKTSLQVRTFHADVNDSEPLVVFRGIWRVKKSFEESLFDWLDPSTVG